MGGSAGPPQRRRHAGVLFALSSGAPLPLPQLCTAGRPGRGVAMAQQRPPGVQIETNMGVFTVELYWNHAPKTCRYRACAPCPFAVL